MARVKTKAKTKTTKTKAKKKTSRTRPVRGDASAGSVMYCPLAELRLDGTNPRFGGSEGESTAQVRILDTIVKTYGVDDVLSSLAVNGYFDAEPLVGVRDRHKPPVRIAEGNRRLAACLILAGDSRARNHAKRTRDYSELRRKNSTSPIRRVPVLIQQDSKALLSYMGVRHIAAAQPWYSYAKAAWVAQILQTDGLTLDEVSEMIGDQHRTVARTLEGFYFVGQLIQTGHFSPRDSLRPGRGSNSEYPFSWVYTALGYRPIRQWLALGELPKKQRKSPVRKNKLPDAGDLMDFLLGNRSHGRQPAITDSRDISDLAKVVDDPEGRRLLKRGKTLQEVLELGRPAIARIQDALFDAKDALGRVLYPLSQGEVGTADAGELYKHSMSVRKLAVQVDNKIRDIATGEGDEGNGVPT